MGGSERYELEKRDNKFENHSGKSQRSTGLKQKSVKQMRVEMKKDNGD